LLHLPGLSLNYCSIGTLINITVIIITWFKDTARAKKRTAIPEGVTPRTQIAWSAATKRFEDFRCRRAPRATFVRETEMGSAGFWERVHNRDPGEEAWAGVPGCALVESCAREG